MTDDMTDDSWEKDIQSWVADCARLEMELAETRKARGRILDELDRTTTARDILKAELSAAREELGDAHQLRCAFEKLRDELTRDLYEARAELRARDEHIRDSSAGIVKIYAQARLAQEPYTGIDTTDDREHWRLMEKSFRYPVVAPDTDSPNLTDWTLSHEARVELERTIDTDQIIEVTFEDSDQ